MDNTKQLFEKHAVTRKKGEVIFCECEPGKTLFFLQEGHVRLSKIVSDKEKILADAGPGEIIGEMAILEKMPRSATCVALSDVRMLELGFEDFVRLVKFKPEIGIKLLKIFSSRIKDQKRKLHIVRLPDDESKVIDVFLMLDENSGRDYQSHGGVRREQEFDVDMPTIANWAGISESACEEILRGLEKQSKIMLQPGKVRIYNMNSFRLTVDSKRKLMENRV